jgi:hypothetical protein
MHCSENTSILAKLDPCFSECIHHRRDGATLPLARRFSENDPRCCALNLKPALRRWKFLSLCDA